MQRGRGAEVQRRIWIYILPISPASPASPAPPAPHLPIAMPPIILIPLLVYFGLFVVKFLVLIPSELIGTFSIPGWLSLTAIALVFSWCFGE